MNLPDQLPPPAQAPDAAPGQGQQPAPGEPALVLDALVRVAGVLVSVLAALLTGVLEVAYATWRVGGFTTGASALVVVPVNLAIAWFAYTTVGRRWAVGPPWAVWTAWMFVAAGVRTAEGDHLLAGDNWVGLITILLGSMAYAIFAYRMILDEVATR